MLRATKVIAMYAIRGIEQIIAGPIRGHKVAILIS